MKKSAQTVIRPDACYTIAAANGRVLEVADFNTENGASVRLWSYEGQPWQQWFFVEAGENEYRIKKAAILLDDSSLSVSDIAINCGFDNISYFIRKFKEYQGITPKKYRSRKMPE